MGRSILVTGGAGYVGSHACKRLAEDGFTPVAFDNLSAGHRWAVRWGPLVEGDIADGAALRRAIAQHRPAAVMHFAGSIAVEESVRDPLGYYENNVGATLTLLEAMREAGLDKLVFSSSAAVYGVPQRVPLQESHPLAPISPYGASKAMVERMLEDFAAAYGFAAVSLRYFNAAGADEGGEIGEAHDPETHLIPRVLDAALGRGEVAIYGEDYDTPDGSCVRDYVHVGDLADAHVLALRYLVEGGRATRLNLGSGRGASVREVVAAAERVTGRTVPVKPGPRRAGDQPVLVADPAGARALLGWQPGRSAIERVVGDAWRWHQRHFAG
jgi:UDP-arabinose 4-epimerase